MRNIGHLFSNVLFLVVIFFTSVLVSCSEDPKLEKTEVKLKSELFSVCDGCGKLGDDFTTSHEEKRIKLLDEKLFPWIRKNGGYIHPSISPFIREVSGTGIGMQATDVIHSDDIIAEIPRKCLISFTSVLEDPIIGPLVKKQDLDYSFFDNKLLTLSIFFVYHLYVVKERSFYYPFFSSLPSEPAFPFKNLTRSVDTLKRHFSFAWHEMYAKLLAMDSKLKMIGEMISEDEILQKEFGDVFRYYSAEEAQTIWSNSMNIIEARNFEFEGDIHLFPFWDSFNYNSENHVIELTNEKESMVIGKTEKALQKGDEIFLSYRRRMTNTQMLTTYGFVLEDNSNDQYHVHFDQKNLKLIDISYQNLLKNEKLQMNKLHVASGLHQLLSPHVPFFEVLEKSEGEEKDGDPVMQFLRVEKRELKKCYEFVTQMIEDSSPRRENET